MISHAAYRSTPLGHSVCKQVCAGFLFAKWLLMNHVQVQYKSTIHTVPCCTHGRYSLYYLLQYVVSSLGRNWCNKNLWRLLHYKNLWFKKCQSEKMSACHEGHEGSTCCYMWQAGSVDYHWEGLSLVGA